jgi:hypothetical protein
MSQMERSQYNREMEEKKLEEEENQHQKKNPPQLNMRLEILHLDQNQ